MKDLLSRIFEDIISNDSDVVKMNCKLDDEIKNIICAHGKDADALSEDELDAFSDVAYLAQRRGFILGMKYAVKLLVNILVSGNLDSGILETDIPEERNSLIGLFTTYQVVRYCQAQSRFAVL